MSLSLYVFTATHKKLFKIYRGIEILKNMFYVAFEENTYTISFCMITKYYVKI